MAKKYMKLPYSVEFRGDDWEAEMKDFAAACDADLPSFVLCRMIHEISLVVATRRMTWSTKRLLAKIESASLKLTKIALEGEDLDD